jgi:hypothetical protein
MKHLKLISELYKKTYIDASQKARSLGHSDKEKDLKRWADIKGISSKNVERINSHRFFFDRNPRSKDNYPYVTGYHRPEEKEKMGPFAPKSPYFSITGFKYKDLFSEKSSSDHIIKIVIEVNFMSNYEETMKMECYFIFHYHPNRPSSGLNHFFNGYINFDNDEKYGKFFKFDNRRDAFKFWNFIKEDVIPELKKEKNEFNDLSSLYILTENGEIFPEMDYDISQIPEDWRVNPPFLPVPFEWITKLFNVKDFYDETP